MNGAKIRIFWHNTTTDFFSFVFCLYEKKFNFQWNILFHHFLTPNSTLVSVIQQLQMEFYIFLIKIVASFCDV